MKFTNNLNYISQFFLNQLHTPRWTSQN